MDRQPYQMTSAEFSEAFPFFSGLSPKAQWRCYRISNKENLRETGEERTWEDFLEFATDGFRWDAEEAGVLLSNSHEYFVLEALKQGEDIPSDVLVEYPETVEKFIVKRTASKRANIKRQEARDCDKKEKAFWKNF